MLGSTRFGSRHIRESCPDAPADLKFWPMTTTEMLSAPTFRDLCSCTRSSLPDILADAYPDMKHVFRSETLLKSLAAAQRTAATVLNPAPSAAKDALTAETVDAIVAALDSAVQRRRSLPDQVVVWADHLLDVLRAAFDPTQVDVARKTAGRRRLEKELTKVDMSVDEQVWLSPAVLIAAPLDTCGSPLLAALFDVFSVAAADSMAVLEVPSALSGWVMFELCARVDYRKVQMLHVRPGEVDPAGLRLVAELAVSASWDEALQVACTLHPAP
jgi:hypothetical protein